MTTVANTTRESFRRYVDLLCELHVLTAAGREDAPEADALRDQMDRPWRDLDGVLASRARGLSADLYSLEEPAARNAPLPPTEESQRVARRLTAARERGDWDDALDLLREAAPYLPAEVVHYLRGTVWLEFGFPALAALFFERAAKIAPEKVNYAWVWLNTLVEARHLDQAVAVAERVLADEAGSHPKLVLKAADVLFSRARTLPTQDAQAAYRRLAEVIERAVDRARLLPPDDVQDSLLAAALVELGTCHEHLRNDEAALAAYDGALSIEPGDEAALTARGILRYGTDTPAALRDLRRAALRDTPLAWPYYYLAHYSLLTRRYRDCLHYCRSALRTDSPAAVKADLFEWLAIAKFETYAPAEDVEADLDAAIRLAPDNQRIQQNRSEFLRLRSTRHEVVPWRLEPESEAREAGRIRLAA